MFSRSLFCSMPVHDGETTQGEHKRRTILDSIRSIQLAVALLIPLGIAQFAAAAIIPVTTTDQGIFDDGECSLQEAIYSANFDFAVAPSSFNPLIMFDTGCATGSGIDVIQLDGSQTYEMTDILDDPYNPLGPTATPIILSNIIIEANGALILRHNPLRDFTEPNFRAFAVAKRSFADPGNHLNVSGDGIGRLTILSAYIKGFTARGGNGTDGGGGGIGAGGAIYVAESSLTIESTTFEDNGARGGNGSIGHSGGGGGLAGHGGSRGPGNSFFGGGGGGGSRGNGGNGNGRGGGGGGTLTDGGSSNLGGFRCGGDGGAGIQIPSGDDGDTGYCPGGGGGGGESRASFPGLASGDGGHGEYGGGGGGGGYPEGDGGHGGFGGGGGAGGFGEFGDAGDGAFGGGGGSAGSSGDLGEGGSFAGDGSEDAGGGGGGLGGAIFSDFGTVVVRNCTFKGNYALRGQAGGTGAQNGQDAGGAIFAVDGSLTVDNSTLALNESTGDGGGIVVYRSSRENSSATFTLRNTIIASNTSNVGKGECYYLNSVSAQGGGNLITNNAVSALPFDNPHSCPGVVPPADPQLGTLELNTPGITPTMAIDTSSPAFDSGDDNNCLDFDQRGVGRPQSAHCDIGAYEVGCSTIACPADITVSNDPGQCGAVVNYPPPTADGSCPVECSLGSGAFFPVGTTPVSCEMGSATCSFNVTVHDVESPTFTCPANLAVSNDAGACGAVLNFSATASDNCPGMTTSCTPASGSFFPVGMTPVSCNATDTSLNASSCSFTATVNDTEPPALSDPSASPSALWPPNHKMRDVALDYTVADNCSSLNTVVSVTSNEPVNGTGDADTSPDWEIVDANGVRLRSERAGVGSGRIYTISVTCTDVFGNATTKSTPVVVGHHIPQLMSNAASQKNTAVNFVRTFLDVLGKTHPARWNFGGSTMLGIFTEPRGPTRPAKRRKP